MNRLTAQLKNKNHVEAENDFQQMVERYEACK